jgi:hypothetical protein
MASSATLALNSAVNRLRVLMVDRPLRHQIHLSRLSQKPGPPLLCVDLVHEDESELDEIFRILSPR